MKKDRTQTSTATKLFLLTLVLVCTLGAVLVRVEGIRLGNVTTRESLRFLVVCAGIFCGSIGIFVFSFKTSRHRRFSLEEEPDKQQGTMDCPVPDAIVPPPPQENSKAVPSNSARHDNSETSPRPAAREQSKLAKHMIATRQCPNCASEARGLSRRANMIIGATAIAIGVIQPVVVVAVSGRFHPVYVLFGGLFVVIGLGSVLSKPKFKCSSCNHTFK